jgi:hypothetical protein
MTSPWESATSLPLANQGGASYSATTPLQSLKLRPHRADSTVAHTCRGQSVSVLTGDKSAPGEGAFVNVRGRPWLVDSANAADSSFPTLSLSSIADDAPGETLEVIWDAEVGASIIDDSGWETVGLSAPDSAEVLAAHVRALRWKSATAADRDLLQAPFRAGIRLDAYQLLPLAERIGTSSQQVSHLELGKRHLTVEWLTRLAEALACHPWEIVSDPCAIQVGGLDRGTYGDPDRGPRRSASSIRTID